MLKTLKDMKLSTKMLIAMIGGIAAGVIIGSPMQEFKFIGDIWLNLLKMTIIPMVVCVVVKGISSMDSPKTLGRVGLKVFVFYMFTTVFAAIISIIVTTIIKPGVGFKFEQATEAFEVAEMLGFREYISSLFSSNMFVSFYEGNMLQVLIISIVLGVSVVFLGDKYREPVKDWFSNMAELTMSMVNIIIGLSPIGVFFLLAASLGEYGLSMIGTMAKMLGTFYFASLLQVLIVYLGILWLIGRVNPLTFLKKSIPTWVAAISTCSSAAVIPVNLRVATEEFGVSESLASFSIPFGAQFNQDGGAVLGAVVILFSAQAIGVEFGMLQLIQMVLVMTLVSAGSGAIPGGGIVRLMIGSAAFGMPLEIVALVAGFYRFFDMGTTSMSTIGDLSATVLIDKLEKKRALKLGKTVS